MYDPNEADEPNEPAWAWLAKSLTVRTAVANLVLSLGAIWGLQLTQGNVEAILGSLATLALTAGTIYGRARRGQ
jgi:4-amino-4-deoxy-L-arabinose transferase-like glycosyltransferase